VNGSGNSKLELIKADGWKILFLMLDFEDLMKLYMVSKTTNKNLKKYVTRILELEHEIFPTRGKYLDGTIDIKIFYPIIQRLIIEFEASTFKDIYVRQLLDGTNVVYLLYDKGTEKLLEVLKDIPMFVYDPEYGIYEWYGNDSNMLSFDKKDEFKIFKNSALEIFHNITHQFPLYKHKNYLQSTPLIFFGKVQWVEMVNLGFLVIIDTKDEKEGILVFTNDIVKYGYENKDPEDDYFVKKLIIPMDSSNCKIKEIKEDGKTLVITLEKPDMELTIDLEKLNSEFVINAIDSEWYQKKLSEE
jgi:hypothetical protein